MQIVLRKTVKSLITIMLLAGLGACGILKTIKLLKKGETVQKNFKTVVPFEMRMGLIILKVQVNGKTCDFVLDTGAPNVISKELAGELGLRPAVTQKTGDSQGKKSSLGYATVKNIRVGGIDFMETGAAIADLKASQEVACLKVEGFIGANLMRKAIWQFDYEKKTITIASSRDSLNISADALRVPFKPALTSTPLIDISYGGQLEKNVTVDLGSNGDFNGAKNTFDKLKSAGAFKLSRYSYGNESSGLYGHAAPDTTFYALLPAVRFGAVELSNQIVSFKASGARTVGTNFFKHYILTFDWTKSELFLSKTSPYSNSDVKKFSFNKIFRDNKLFIGTVFELAPGGEGPMLGDQIITLNGNDVSTCSPDTWCEILYNDLKKADDEVRLVVLRNAKEMFFNLKREDLLTTP